MTVTAAAPAFAATPNTPTEAGIRAEVSASRDAVRTTAIVVDSSIPFPPGDLVLWVASATPRVQFDAGSLVSPQGGWSVTDPTSDGVFFNYMAPVADGLQILPNVTVPFLSQVAPGAAVYLWLESRSYDVSHDLIVDW